MNEAQTFTDNEIQRFVNSIAALGFETSLANRTQSNDDGYLLSPAMEDEIRRCIQDNAQFIVPITWSARDAIGLPLPADLTPVNLMKSAINALYDASSQQVMQYRADPKLGVSNWAAVDAYLHSAIRASAQYPDGTLRQGYLVVCMNGIALVGIHVDWSAQYAFEGQREQLFFLRTEMDIISWMSRQLPPPNAPYSLNELAYIPYSGIQEIKTAELLRLDGLAALIATVVPGNQYYPNGDKQGKQWSKLLTSRDRPTSPLERYEQMWNNFPDVIDASFLKVMHEIVSYGFSPATGVPVENGLPKKQIFTRGLALNVIDSRNGTGFLVESVFSELDTASSLISELRQNSQEKPSEQESIQANLALSPQTDLASQLQKLTELHSSGALTDEEFRGAKQKLLS